MANIFRRNEPTRAAAAAEDRQGSSDGHAGSIWSQTMFSVCLSLQTRIDFVTKEADEDEEEDPVALLWLFVLHILVPDLVGEDDAAAAAVTAAWMQYVVRVCLQ